MLAADTVSSDTVSDDTVSSDTVSSDTVSAVKVRTQVGCEGCPDTDIIVLFYFLFVLFLINRLLSQLPYYYT